MDTDFSTQSITEIVRSNYRTAGVFKKYGINYCCGGSVSFEDICRTTGLDHLALEKELSAAIERTGTSQHLSYHTCSEGGVEGRGCHFISVLLHKGAQQKAGCG